MTAYATIDDVLPLFKTAPQGARLERLEALLEVATDEIINECGGRDFFRHPTTGTRTFSIDASGGRVLHFHEGLISIELLEYSLDQGDNYLEFEGTDWQLRGSDYGSTETPADGQPFFHLELNELATRRTFPAGTSLLRVTGATGWPRIPALLREVTAVRARQLAYADSSYSGSVPGADEYNAGGGVSDRWPQILWNFLRADRRRFMACSM